MEKVKKALQLKNEIDALRPLKKEDESRLMQKLRLDWNYHSNNLEGNSLTYGETKALILYGITAQGKPLKDHFEITGHDEAVKWVEDIVKEDRPLSENFIRELHQLILKESYEVDALTPDGKPTKKKIELGKYKSSPNHVQTKTGEMFYFASPEETPARMTALLDWYRQKSTQIEVNPILLAAEFHYRFILIHPFDDGNGRTARILMNLILMKFGYPPVVIKTQDKANYFAALRQADAGILEAFIEYIAENLIHSLEIMIKAAKGESIDEPDDIDKQIALLERKLEGKGERVEKVLSKEVLEEFWNKTLPFLEQEFLEKNDKFKRFYKETKYYASFISLDHIIQKYSFGYQNHLTNYFLPKTNQFVLDKKEENSWIELHANFTSFNKKSLTQSNFSNHIRIHFFKTYLQISSSANENRIKIYYSEQIKEETINTLIKELAQSHLDFIESQTK